MPAGMFPDIRDPGGDPKMEALRRLLLQQAGIPEIAPPSLRTQDPTRGGLLADPLAALQTPIAGAQELLTSALTPRAPEPQTMPLPNTEAYRDVFRRRLAGETFEPQGPVEVPPPMDPAESLAFLQDRAAPTPAVSGEEVPSRPAGGLGAVEQPGDVARLRAEKKIAQLTAFRDIAEGLGRPIPVKGDITTGLGMPEPFRAEGIRGAIGREDVKLADLAVEDKLRLQSQLRREEDAAALGAKGPRTLKASEIKGYEAGRNFLAAAADIRAQVDKMAGSIGPIDNILDKTAALIGMQSGDVAEFRRKVSAQLNKYIKNMTGAQLSREEAKRLRLDLPQLSDGEAAFKAKLEGVIADIERRTEDWIEDRRSLGYDVSFADIDEIGVDGGDMLTFRNPETDVEEQVPRDKETEARAAGWTLVNADS